MISSASYIWSSSIEYFDIYIYIYIYTTYVIDTTALHIKDTNNIFIDLCQVDQNKICRVKKYDQPVN